MRLFTAVELPPDVRAATAAAARESLAGSPGMRLVGEENLHVTVRFLGETDASRLPALRAAFAAAAASVSAATVRIRWISSLRWSVSPRVACAEVEDPDGAIAALERASTEHLVPLGILPEDRPFRAHVTVARARRASRRSPWRGSGPSRSVSGVACGPPFDVRELTLFESRLTPAGPVYTAAGRFPLRSPSPTPQAPGLRPAELRALRGSGGDPPQGVTSS